MVGGAEVPDPPPQAARIETSPLAANMQVTERSFIAPGPLFRFACVGNARAIHPLTAHDHRGVRNASIGCAESATAPQVILRTQSARERSHLAFRVGDEAIACLNRQIEPGEHAA